MKISYSFKAIAAQVATIIQAAGLNVSKWNGTAVPAPTVAGYPLIDVSKWAGTAVAATDTAGYPKVTHKSGTGTGELDLSSGKTAVQKVIKSIQYGTITLTDPNTTGTATLGTSVNTANSVLIFLGQSMDAINASARITLTSSTVVTATRASAASGASVTVSFVVVEFQ